LSALFIGLPLLLNSISFKMKKLYFIILFAFIGVIANAQNIYTIAGGGTNDPGDGGPATSAVFYGGLCPSLTMDAAGNIYFSQYSDALIRKVDAVTGIISTIAGTGTGGFNGDNILATSAQLSYPRAVAFDKAGNLYIADEGNSRIRKIDVSTGLISTVAGTGIYGNQNGISATSANIGSPFGIVLDTMGNIYFSEVGEQYIKKVDASTGIINIIAGTGVSGFNGDNIPALSAKLHNPEGLSIGKNGNIYFADSQNRRIRMIDNSNGLIYTVAGCSSFTGIIVDNIPADSAELSGSESIAFDLAGNLYIADANRIRKVNTSGIISTVAGTGVASFNGDSIPATTATLNGPRAVYVDSIGNIYIADDGNDRIRKVFRNFISQTLINSTCNGVCNGSVNATTTGGDAPYTFSWNGGLGAGASHSNVCAGTYVVTATDAHGFAQTTTVTINEPTPITVTITTIDATCSNNGSASAIVAGGVAPYSYSWPVGGNSASTTGLSVGNHSLTINDSNNCAAIQTFTISLNPSLFTPVPICMVTVDANSQHNIVMWDKTSYTNVDSFIVYRETSTSIYNRIGAVSFGALSQFIDTTRTMYFPNTGNPNQGTFRYKLQARDTCGNYTQLSPYHNTIYIIDNGNGTFYWTQLYTIESGSNPVNNYVLMRDDNSTGNWQPVTSVAGTQQTVNDPLYSIYQSTAQWRVQTQWGITCTPTLRTQNNTTSNFSTSFSNSCLNNPNAIKNNSLENKINVYPTLSNGNFIVEVQELKNARVEIYSVMGELVNKSELKKDKNEINLTGFVKGTYVLHVISDNVQSVKRIIIE